MKTYYMITARAFIDAQNGADIRERIISILVEHPRDILIDCKHVDYIAHVTTQL